MSEVHEHVSAVRCPKCSRTYPIQLEEVSLSVYLIREGPYTGLPFPDYENQELHWSDSTDATYPDGTQYRFTCYGKGCGCQWPAPPEVVDGLLRNWEAEGDARHAGRRGSSR